MFATVYLSPQRLPPRAHAVDGHACARPCTFRGGCSASAPDAVGSVPRLFARNERLVCHFDTDFGPMALVMVGALLVSGVETVWSGVEIPPYGGPITRKDWRGKGIVLERFAEMARFNYGSTVIVLLPKGVAELAPTCVRKRRCGWVSDSRRWLRLPAKAGISSRSIRFCLRGLHQRVDRQPHWFAAHPSTEMPDRSRRVLLPCSLPASASAPAGSRSAAP